jgi:hypothetical protein
VVGYGLDWHPANESMVVLFVIFVGDIYIYIFIYMCVCDKYWLAMVLTDILRMNQRLWYVVIFVFYKHFCDVYMWVVVLTDILWVNQLLCYFGRWYIYIYIYIYIHMCMCDKYWLAMVFSDILLMNQVLSRTLAGLWDTLLFAHMHTCTYTFMYIG